MNKHKSVILQMLAVLLLTSSSAVFAQNELDDADVFLPMVASEQNDQPVDDPNQPNGEEGKIEARSVEEIAFDNTLVGKASLIFKGVVSGLECEIDTETGTPFTYVTFRQIEPIKDVSGEFASGDRDRLRIRLFGGLNEDGTETIMTDIPSFMLGAVYVVFYTSGEWDVSPVVDGEHGVFQVIRSRTLGHEILLDYHGDAVVGFDVQGVKTVSLDLSTTQDTGKARVHDRVTTVRDAGQAVQQTTQFKVDPNSIYTEEAVERMMAAEGKMQFEFEESSPPEAKQVDATSVQPELTKAHMLQGLSTPPMSYEAFSKSILSLEKSFQGKSLSAPTLRLEGNPVNKVRNAAPPK